MFRSTARCGLKHRKLGDSPANSNEPSQCGRGTIFALANCGALLAALTCHRASDISDEQEHILRVSLVFTLQCKECKLTVKNG